MPIKTTTLERATWVLLYGGLLLLCLGIFVDRRDDALGIGIQIFGAAAAALGVVLIWVRSRMKGP